MSELVDEWLSENEPTQKVRQNVLATTQTPDDAARALKLAERTGSNSLVASVYQDALLQADMAKRATKAAEVPGLGTWLEDQQNYAVAQDDLDHLPWWESMTPTNALRAGKSLKAEYDYGWNNIEASGLRLRNDPTYQALGAKPLTDKEKYRLLVLDGKKEPEDRVPFLGPAAKQIPNFLNQIVAPVTGWQEGYMQQREAVREGYRTDGVLGAVREQILKAPDPVVGLVRGFFSPTFVPEAGGAYQELSSVRDDAGKPIDQNTIAIASMAVGGLNTAIELYSDVALAAAFGLTSGLAAPAVAEGVVAKEAAKLAVKETAKKSLMRLTTQKAFERAGLELAKTVGIQNAEEIAQETVTMAAVQLSKELSGGTWKPADPSEIMERYAQIIWETTQSSLVFGAVGAGVHYAVDAQAIKQANEAEAMMEEMGRQSSESKLRARMPAKYAQAVQSIRDANGGALSEVPIDADRFVQYFQDQGVDPAAIAEELGVPASALQQAYSTGGTVDISIGQYAAKIAPTQHHKALYEHARILAGGRSIAEAREIEQTGDHFMRMAEQIRKESEDKVALSRSEEKVRDAVLEDLKAAGIYRPEIARQQVELPVALWTVMGKRLGVDPYTAFSERRLRVRGEVAGVKMEMADADLSQVREQASKYGSDVRDWMLDRAEGKSPAETADYWVSQGAVDLNDTTIDQALRRTRTAIQKKLDSGLTRAEVADQYNVSEEVIEALFAKQAPGRKPNLQREVERLMREYPDLGLTEMTARLRNISGLENTEKNTVKVVKSRINKRMREDQTTLHQADGAGLTPFWIKVGVTNEHVEVLPNPSMSELRSILMQQKRDGEPMSVRFLVTEDGTVYAWDGGKVWHQDVLDKLGLRADQVERGEVNDPKDLPIINEIASTKRGPDLYQSVKGYDPYGERRTDLENRIEEASQVLGQKFSDFRRNRPARDANLGKSGKRDAGRADRARGDGNAAGTGPSLEEAIGKITAASSVRIFKNPPTATGRFGQYQVRLDVPVEPDASWNATVYGVFDSYIEFDTLRSGRGNQPADVGPRGDIQIKWSTTAIDVRDTGLGKFLYRQLLDWAFSENRRVFSDAQLSPASQILYGRKLAEYGYEVVAVAPDAEFDSTGWLRSPSRQPLFEVRPRPDATPYAHAPMDGLKIDGPSLRQRLKDNDQTTLNQPAGPIYYSALQRAVETSKQAKAPAAQWKAVLSKAPGIKKEEIEWSGVNDWLDAQEGSVTREALAAYLDQNGVKVEEVVKGAPSGAEATQIQQKLLPAIEERDRLIAELDDGGDEATINPRLDELQALISELSDRHYNGGQEATKWSSYTLPGGSNYRELLLTLPMKDRQGFEDYLARYRAKYPNATTTDAEVRQFHNQGVPLPGEGAGFQRVETTGDVYRSSHWSEPNVLAHVRFDERTDVNGKRTLLIHEVQSDKGARWRVLKDLIEKGQANESQKAEFAMLDAMPFNKTNDYSALILKRMIRWASENGFDQVAWTPGQVQAERFGLETVVERIEFSKNKDGTIDFIAAQKSGGYYREDGVGIDRVREVFGAEIAAKMENPDVKPHEVTKDYKSYELKGLDLRTGGEGMKAFYDKVLPNIANDIGKKYSAKVETSAVPVPSTQKQTSAYRPEEFAVEQRDDQWAVTMARSRVPGRPLYDTREEADTALREILSAYSDKQQEVFTLPITDALRAAAMEGMPLFQGAKGLRGAISMPSFMTGLSAGETATMRLTEASDLSTYLHEFGHYALAVYQSIAAEEGAPQAIKDDMAAIHSWMRSDESAAIIAREASIYSNKRITKADVQNLENLTDDVHIWRASHELFSRTFEAYLLEGKAPSVGLRKAFASFKAWLMQVYKSLTLGGTNFAPEIKDVMDRMLATEEQIAEVRAQESMGIMTREQFPGTDKQWERYKEQGEAAREAAAAELQLEIMEAYVKQQRASWNVERRRIRKTVERDVDQNPARRAYDWLSRGVWKGDIERTGKTGSKLEPAWGSVKPPENLQPMALDTGAVVEDYGPEALANLPREVKPENREAVDALVEDIRRVRKMLKRKKPRTLAEYVRDMGGLRDETGDVLAMIGTKQAFPGLIRPNGRYLDDAALSAWEGKYFGAGPGKGFMQYAIAQSNFDAVKRWVERHSPAMSEDWFAMRAAFEAELEAAASGPRGDIWTKARKDLALAYWQDAVERARGVGSEDWARKASQSGIKAAEASLFGEMRSEGLLYQVGQTQTAAFKEWFGDSKVVDSSGQPLVVYHGAPDARFAKSDGIFKTAKERWGSEDPTRAFWFASSRRTASTYADDHRAWDYQNADPAVISVYLKLENPLVIDAGGKEWREAQARGKTRDVLDEARDAGHDGVIIHNVIDDYHTTGGFGKTTTYAVFSPNQIKSATNNSGEFNADNPSMLYQFGSGLDDQIGRAHWANSKEVHKFKGGYSFEHEGDRIRVYLSAEAPGVYAASWDFGSVRDKGQQFDNPEVRSESGLGGKPQEALGKITAIIERFAAETDANAITFMGLTDAHTRLYSRMLLTLQVEGWTAYDVTQVATPKHELAIVKEGFDAKQIWPSAERLVDPISKADIKGQSQRYMAMRRAEIASYALTPEAQTLFQDGDMNGRPTINQFLDALRADLQNRDHYSDADNLEVQEMLNAQENAAWYADRGIDINADAATMRQQIQNYLNSQWDVARHPDEIADIFGFESGEAFLKALANLKPRHEEIEAETNRRMIEENGDPFLDGTIAEEARLAAHNEVQARQIEIELEALQRAAGVSVASKAAKGAAAAQLQNMTIKQIKNADWFLAAERRASSAAVVALESGNYREAILHKQRQLLNFWLYRLARDETKKIDRAEKRWKDLSNKESVRNRIDPDYREKIDAILDGYEIRSSAQGPKRQWENQQLLEWVQQMKDQGLDHMVAVDPRIIQNAQRRPVNTLSLDEFNGLKDTIANLEHLGRLKDKLLNEQDKRRFEELIDDITKSIADNGPVQKSKSKSYSPTPLEAIDERRRQAHAQLSRPEFMFRLMDGLEDNGPVWRALFLPFAQAEDVETRLMSDMTTRIKEAFDRYTPRERAKLFTVRYDMPDLAVEGRQAYTRAELLSLALNWGNEGNRQAVLEGYGWTSEGVDRALTRLDERDWQVVQDIWRAIDSLWPEIAKMQKALTGVVPEKVQAMPVQTRFGVIEGGYYPLKYDRTKNERVNQREEKKEVQELFGSNWMRPATRQGHTIERVGSNGQPVLLTLDVLTDHVRNAIHDIAFRKAVIDADRIIQNPRFQEAMIASVGREQYRQLRPWLQSIAADIVDPSTYWVKFLSQIRANTSIAAMGFKVGTATQQITGLFNAIPRVGAGSLAKGFARMYANPFKTGVMWGFIRQRSEYMRNRRNNFDRDVRDAMNTMKKEGALNDVRRFAFVMVGEMDFMVSSSAWIAAYDNARAGKVKNIDPVNEADAIAHADSVVRMTQTAGMPKDLPAVMRGAEGNKLFTAFYSFFSVLYNQLNNEQIAGVAMGKISKAQFAANMFMLMIFAPILAEALAGRLAPKDDEDWEDVLKRELPVILLYYFSTIVGVRDLINAAGTGMDYQVSPVGSSLNAVAKTANAIGSGEADLGNEYTQKRAANAAGVLLGLPSGQAWITGDYVRDVAEGDEDPIAEPGRIITEGLLRDTR